MTATLTYTDILDSALQDSAVLSNNPSNKLQEKWTTIAENDFEIQTVLAKDDNMHEAISALQVLGYPVKDATKAVSSIDCTGLSVEDIIKKALIYFTKQ